MRRKRREGALADGGCRVLQGLSRADPASDGCNLSSVAAVKTQDALIPQSFSRGQMHAPWKVGDKIARECPTCRTLVRSSYEFRTIRMPRSRLRVRDVLVDICPGCGGMLGVPRQSLAELREAGVAK
ncbi:MAG: hypothetical protein NVS4B3_11670 [Gemmatimonadaceae bacterium]